MKTIHQWTQLLAAVTTSLALLAGSARVGAAELIAGSAPNGKLVLFASDSPEDVAVVQLTGLQPGEEILGIDVRPATGRLYALGSSSRIYTLDPASGNATALTGEPFTPALSGRRFGFDFNPTVDRIRITSHTGQNLRAHPDTGLIVGVDTNLAYAVDDPGFGSAPGVVASAYINNDTNPATGTELLNIDAARGVLVVQNPPNLGALTTRGPLGLEVSDIAGFDVAGSDGTAYAALVPAGQPGNSARASLYTINLMTGAATHIGKIGGPKPLTSLATLGQLP